MKNLVLAGGGHSHVAVLRAFGMRPVEGVRLTLVSPESHTAYSGMLPGLIAGHYGFDDAHIDLSRLALFAGARFIRAGMSGLDQGGKQVLLSDRPPIPYDLLSINTGSTPPLSRVPGALEHALPVKPFGAFLERRGDIENQIVGAATPKNIVIVGAGAGGLELAMAIRYRFRDNTGLTIRVVESAPEILPGFPASARRRVLENLTGAGIEAACGRRVVAVAADCITLAGGDVHPADRVFWTTGATPPAWFGETGLSLDEGGFLAVRPTLQNLSAADVFAAGDCATMIETPRPKAGVFAVRQGPVLAENLRRALLGQPVEPYRPQKRFLTILATGRRHAIAVKGPFAVSGDQVWRWKDRIDRAFMRRFSQFPPMDDNRPRDRLPELPADTMQCGGCGSKLPASALSRALSRLGLDEAGDDAAVIDPPRGRQLAVSVDHFPALIDDPYVFGQIAANHALSDIHAMGAKPTAALAIATVAHAAPDIAEDDLFQLVSGALAVFEAEGVRLLGGHSTQGTGLALGFSVMGEVEPGNALKKSGLTPGDVLVLTKPLGTGAIFAAHARGEAKGRWLDGAIATMLRSNGPAATVFRNHGATALTDVTGFGLAGHLGEMLEASGVSAILDGENLPVLNGARAVFDLGIESSLAPSNRDRFATLTGSPADPSMPAVAALCDPQTAGGLLAGVPAGRAEACLKALHDAGDGEAAAIGRVEEKSGPLLKIEPS